ncbi:MAG: nucleotidyltransferase domain-containing protein, partial [bacterium]
ADDVITLYRHLEENGILVWLDGGWGVDALLEEQTRPHKDVDVVVRAEDVARMREILSRAGFELAEGTATSFVLRDPVGREIDVHVARLDEHGNGIYRMENGENWVYPAEGFTGKGKIGTLEVRCLSPSVLMLCHTGYELRDKHIRDMELLRERFGVDFPVEHAHVQRRDA